MIYVVKSIDIGTKWNFMDLQTVYKQYFMQNVASALGVGPRL